jgi:hypothetical protein
VWKAVATRLDYSQYFGSTVSIRDNDAMRNDDDDDMSSKHILYTAAATDVMASRCCPISTDNVYCFKYYEHDLTFTGTGKKIMI